MPIAVVLILLVIGTLVFHFVAPLWGWTFTELASDWGQIDDTINITFWVTGFVFVAVNLFMAYAVVKYRAKEGGRATYDPENKKLETWLTILTSVGVAAMLTPGLFVWGDFVNVPDDAIEIEAIGQQWHWTYRLPGEDGEFGDVKAELIDNDNPFGMDPEDPLGRDDVLINHPPSPHELYTPTAGSHWVRGHYRRNGTYVAPYRRSKPNGVCWDNIRGDLRPIRMARHQRVPIH